ncbi:DUF3226 domain-containing protein [Polyangium aurulentum]|uniref:DUF3226 domain-containing protein n=1 Tax=Polyangium aurulentum TaxID=2567896 RepID=UPI0010AE8E6D|nr:DUF3226 domain-containing protein [Polyangium aurulentum]UQA55622.1 hypothetical protein E8A73_030310 [Polyangium aurulentum]
MSAPDINKCKRVLVVEGYSDLLFFAEALECCGNLEGVFIKEMKGKGDLVTKLETFLRPDLLAEKAAIAVIADADANASGTVASLESRLSSITGQGVKDGRWTVGPPRLGLFIVPGNGRAGEIESLVWDAWSSDPVHGGARTCVETFLEGMAGQGHSAKSPDKGRIGALLSVLNDEDPRLGPGARARVFDFSRPQLEPLFTFLRHL